MQKADLKNLERRYLIWLYKTAKEAFDRVERKFTQLKIDRIILKELMTDRSSRKIAKFIAEFAAYIDKKEKEGLSLKYEGKELKSDYLFLERKLAAVEKAIVETLGSAGLDEIKSLYEKEMTERILKSTEH